MLPTCSELTGHCRLSPVGLSNKTPPHISLWVGWRVCSITFHYPPLPPCCSYRSHLSRSSRGGRSETSEPPAGFDRTADCGGSRMMGGGPAALEEWSSPVSTLLWRTSPGSPTSPQDLFPMETTGSQRCGTETEQQHLSHSSPCLPAFFSPPCLPSWMTCHMTQTVWMLLETSVCVCVHKLTYRCVREINDPPCYESFMH